MKHIKTLDEYLFEKKYKVSWKDSDAPDAEGRFKDLGIKDLASWLIKTRKKDLKKISGSLTQQIVFNRGKDSKYAEKMEKTRKEVYKQLGREDLLKESLDNENFNDIQYGNSPIEFLELINKNDDPIKNWFIEAGLVEKIKNAAPKNDSAITKNDLELLIEKTSKATAEEITFARYVDDTSNLAQTFIDLLKENGHEESMGEFFGIDQQADSLLFFLKDVINRPRPYQLAKSFNYPLYPLIRTDAMTASYPSGHALTGFILSEYYAKKYPDIAEKLKILGHKIALSREITGIHYPSDTEISKKICEIIFKNNLIKDETY
jgi:hypothetical protein